jgi:type IV secretory pathway VirB4 component
MDPLTAGRPPEARSRGWVRRRPTLRLPRHRGTTAHVCALYPFSVQSGLGHRGAYVGTDVLTGGGPFFWDPFEAYDQQLTTNPNTWVLGEPGNGKSALIKTLLYRMAGLWGLGPGGRFVAICDPKGEYRMLAELLDLPVLRLAPGGSVRLNPLDSGPGAATVDVDRRVLHHASMLNALLATVMGHPLSPFEDAIVFAVVDHLARRDASTLADVAALLHAPTSDIAARVNHADRQSGDTSALVYALDKLLTRSLRGMFDGHSTITVDWDGPGLVLDLSAVQHDLDALPLVMVAATAWLQTLMAEHHGRRRVQVLDEAWCLLGARHTASYLQSCWKLGRSYGVANIAVAHRPTDLAAQADDGTATAKMAAGLLADTATKIVLRQAPDQLSAVGELVGLTPPERAVVGHLVRGRALWRVGAGTAVVQHHVAGHEQAWCDTDARMRAPVAEGTGG